TRDGGVRDPGERPSLSHDGDDGRLDDVFRVQLRDGAIDGGRGLAPGVDQRHRDHDDLSHAVFSRYCGGPRSHAAPRIMTEEKFAGYLKLVEACAEPGCPICRCVVAASHRYLDAVLYEL